MICTARNTSPFGYIGLVCNMRFTIYDVYDDSVGGCSSTLVWDNDYRFIKKLAVLGAIKSMDFE